MGSNRYPIREIAAEENVTYNAAFKSVSQARQQDFLKVFWEYVIEAGYKFGWKNSDTVHFYHGIVDRGLKLEFSNGFFRADPHTLLSIAF